MQYKGCRGATVAQKGFLRAIACDVCGYVHLDPKPTQGQLDALYSDEYYQTHNAGWYEKERNEQWYWRRVYRQRLATARRWVSADPMRIYDVGCGFGWFGAALPEQNVLGTEPNSYARAIAQEIVARSSATIRHNVLGAMREPYWHWVHLSLILEHLIDPLDTLKRAYKDLLPGGVVCVVVPNEWNPYQVELARRYGYTPIHEHHVNYFSSIQVQYLLERAGFEIVRLSATFPMEWLALHGLNYVKHPNLGKYAHWLRMAIEATALSVDAAAWERRRDGWAERGIGRESEIWAIKR